MAQRYDCTSAIPTAYPVFGNKRVLFGTDRLYQAVDPRKRRRCSGAGHRDQGRTRVYEIALALILIGSHTCLCRKPRGGRYENRGIAFAALR